MMMKYFRLLYGETGRYFIHFGEIKDTKTGEKFSFLYLRRVKKHVNQTETEHALFLCPKNLDLVVLGDADRDSAETVRELLEGVTVETLVCDANLKFAGPGLAPGVKKVVYLDGNLSEENDSAYYRMEAAGWRTVVRSFGNGSLMMAHDLAAHDLTFRAAERNAESLEAGYAYPYKDCAMSVKVVTADKRCCSEQEPDGYGCAMGCSLHQDYDVCNYQRKDGCPYVTGTVLLPEDCNGLVREVALRELKGSFSDIRFFGLSGATGADALRAVTDAICSRGTSEAAAGADKEKPESSGADAYRRYFIGAGGEVADETIAAACRGSIYHTPLILEPGKALCCSGLLKYRE